MAARDCSSVERSSTTGPRATSLLGGLDSFGELRWAVEHPRAPDSRKPKELERELRRAPESLEELQRVQ
eukprot:8040379-Alexandrium_andersonii.AAC.1